MKKSSKRKAIKGAEIGGAITAAVLAAAAGAYLMSDKKNQAKMKAWTKKAQLEVAKKAKAARRLGQKEYGAIVDQVVARYGSLEDVSGRDVMQAAKQIKAQWDSIQKEAKKFAKTKPSGKSKRKTAAKKKPAKRAHKK